jgi:hypothetical protein
MTRDSMHNLWASDCAWVSRQAKGGPARDRLRGQEGGWALLGLILAMSIMAIVLSSAIIPNVRMQVQREKEIEMVYRGEQMAQGIARYYGRGALNPLQLLVPPDYGYLTDLKKIRSGFTIGIREVKFVRPSAFIDPMSSTEWEPVRARDPRIMKVLQAYAAETGTLIPQQYLLIAAPPQKMQLVNKPASSDTGTTTGTQPATTPGGTTGAPGATPGGPAQPGQSNPPRPGVVPPAKPSEDADDDDDDDEDNADPLAHLFFQDEPGHSNAPIVGVAPKVKGTAIKPLYGLDKYEEWVFIYIPPQFQFGAPGVLNRPGIPTAPPSPPARPGRPQF